MRFRRTQGVVLLGAAPFSHSWISPTLLPNASWMGPAVRRLGVDALERVDGYSASLLSALDPSYRGRERERPGHRWVAQLARVFASVHLKTTVDPGTAENNIYHF